MILRDFNILLVDDSKIVRFFMEKALHLAAVSFHEIFHAENGQEALDIIGKTRIDMVFCDINMPVMGGIEMIERLDQDGLLDKIPVVVVSTEGSTKRVDYLLGKGVRGYIRKPFHPEEFRDSVEDILRQDK